MLRALLPGLVLVTVSSPRLGAQSRPDSLPPGVSRAMIDRGRALFAGAGLCLACHGPDGKGSVGPDLTDTVWLHHKGSYEDILAQVIEGIPAEKSKSGVVMPPRGGAALKDEEIRAVAAYVWSLSRRGSRRRRHTGPNPRRRASGPAWPRVSSVPRPPGPS